MNISYWEKETFLQRANAVIIGAGLVGLHAAWHLRRMAPSLRVVVLEAGPWPGRASLRNAGFACFGSPSELLADLDTRPADAVASLVAERLEGLHLLRKGLGEEAIGFRPVPAYEVFAEERAALAARCEANLAYLNDLVAAATGQPLTYRQCAPPPGTREFAAAFRIEGEGQVHPGKMMYRLAALAREAGVEIYTGWPVKSIFAESGGVILEGAGGMKLKADKVLVATNGFTSRLLPELDVLPARNQVFVTEEMPGLELRGNFHGEEGYVYFRNVGKRLLIGGFRHLESEAEQTAEPGFSPVIQAALHQYVDRHLLPAGTWKVAQRWSGTLGVGGHKAPILKQVQPGLFCAVRLGGMGVALGAKTGLEAARLLLGHGD